MSIGREIMKGPWWVRHGSLYRRIAWFKVGGRLVLFDIQASSVNAHNTERPIIDIDDLERP